MVRPALWDEPAATRPPPAPRPAGPSISSGLDDRKANLRNCNYSQNNANRRCSPHATSPYLGVSWNSRRGKWAAAIKKDGLAKNLGLYESEVEAARAYDAAARALHGIYANLNFPDHPAAGPPGNPKPETRNPKQIPIPNDRIPPATDN